ncbi:MAG: WD40/YVTN/BNR-like repeat-containing protein, partial [Thermoanaerobaculia bacterium]
SNDGALSWRPASQGLPYGTVSALAVAPSDPRTVYASVDNGVHEGVFRSKNGGASWQATAGPPLPVPQGRVLALAVSPQAPATVWAGTDPSGLFRSTDGGAHWTAAGLPPQEQRVPAIAVAPSSPGLLYAGVTAQRMDLGGVYASADGGASWMRRNQGLAGLDARAVAVPPGSPGVIFAGLSGPGLFRSGNSGKRWARVALPGPSLPVNGIPLVDFEIAPSSVSTFYALALSWLWRSTDAGASWTEAFAPLSGPFLQFLRVDPADPSRLWGGSFKSTDGGETWVPLTTPGVLWCQILDLQFAPSSPSTLYVAGAKLDSTTTGCKFTQASLFRSTDDGATWTEADAGLGAHSVTALAVDPLDPRLLYAGTGGSFIYSGNGVWKSTDGGGAWARAGDELQGRTITAVAVSPLSVAWAATGGSVFRGADGGATWSDRTDGLQAVTIYKLLIDPADPRRVYAATSSGVWVLEETD